LQATNNLPRFFALLLDQGFADPVPVEPTLDADCRALFVIDPAPGQLGGDGEIYEWLPTHVRDVCGKLLLQGDTAFEIAARYNLMLAMAGLESPQGEALNYEQIGRDLLKKMGLVTVSAVTGGANLILVQGKRERLSDRGEIITQERVARLFSAGYRDMREALVHSVIR
jgi:hypothetical protein